MLVYQSGNICRPFISFPKCQEFFTAFFEIAPVGQNYFKQSLTRLLFIADKVLWLCGDVFLIESCQGKVFGG